MEIESFSQNCFLVKGKVRNLIEKLYNLSNQNVDFYFLIFYTYDYHTKKLYGSHICAKVQRPLHKNCPYWSQLHTFLQSYIVVDKISKIGPFMQFLPQRQYLATKCAKIGPSSTFASNKCVPVPLNCGPSMGYTKFWSTILYSIQYWQKICKTIKYSIPILYQIKISEIKF